MRNLSQSIEQLISRARAGDAESAAELQSRLGPALRKEIEREVAWLQNRTDANRLWEDALSQAWRRFSEFGGTTATELTDWLRMALRQQLPPSDPPAVGNLDTIAPPRIPDQQTIVSAPPRDTVAKPPDPPAATNQKSVAPPPDPSSVTTRDANQGTVVIRPTQDDASQDDASQDDAGQDDASQDDASQDDAARDDSVPSAVGESDPLATIVPGGEATQGGDPLATIVPGGDTTQDGDPLATISRGSAGRAASRGAAKVFGDYVILDTIAQGGMGVVYKARHRKLNRIVALKMILSGQFANGADIERFHAEAEAAARLSHPNIVGIHDVGQYDGQHYFTMQFVEGKSLADLVRERPLQPRAAAKYMADISEAMQYAHDHGILHRDLKPANILVDGEGVPLITDFGLAKLNPSDASGDDQARAGQSQMTMDGTVMGTASYMPPEQALGRLDEISERSDVYSLGATLYDLLTGKPPFGAANVHETIRQVIDSEPVAPRVLNASVPKDLETICLKCLQKMPARRYATSQELSDELRRFIAGEPIHARPVSFVERTIRWCYRNPWPTTAICASLFGLIVATVLWQSAVSARDKADKANTIAQEKRAEAEASRAQLLGAINKLFTTWGSVKLLNEPALTDVRSELLKAATELYADISKHLGDDPELQQELGVSYYRLGQMMFNMKSYAEADVAVQSALKIQRRAISGTTGLKDASEAESLKDLGESLTLGGNILVEISRRQRLDRLAEAAKLYQEAIDVRSQLVAHFGDEPEHERQLLNSQMNLGTVSQWQGELYANQSFALAEQDPQLAQQRYAQAEDRYRDAQTQFNTVQQQRQGLLARLPEDASVRYLLIQDLAQGDYNLANVTLWLQDFVLASSSGDDAIRDFGQLLATIPGELSDEFDLTQARFDLARCHELAGDIAVRQIYALFESEQAAMRRKELYGEGMQHYRDATSILRKLDASSPAIDTRYRVALGRVLFSIGDLQLNMEDDAQARQAFQEAIDVLERLVAADPSSPQLINDLEMARDGLNLTRSDEAIEPANKPPGSESQPVNDPPAPKKPPENDPSIGT